MSEAGMAKPPAASALVGAFLAAATSAFRPILQDPGARWSSSVRHMASDEIIPAVSEKISGLFFAEASFENHFVAGAITFGDREYLINTVIGAAGYTARYGLWEWADALGRPDVVPRDTGLVLTVGRVETIVGEMARGVAELQEAIGASTRDTIDRIERARERVQAESRSRLREEDHRRASTAAADAFRAGNYVRVIELLTPFGDLLTPAEREKLGYAKRHY